MSRVGVALYHETPAVWGQLLGIVLVTWIALAGAETIAYGCAQTSTRRFNVKPNSQLTACPGSWSGHVNTAGDLCASGWHVCSGGVDDDILRTITVKDVWSLRGCYAVDATHGEDGKCEPCQNQLAAVGNTCEFLSSQLPSCFQGVRTQVPKTDKSSGCSYQKDIVSGVLCCKNKDVPPSVLVSPEPLIHVRAGVTFVLSCQAVGSPPPRVSWRRDGRSVATNDTRFSEFTSGYLLVSFAHPEDSGDYQCVAENRAGNKTIQTKVLVTDYPSGCADGATDALFQYQYIHGCKGSWKGHVRRAKHLCAVGWRVCSYKNYNLIFSLNWTDTMNVPGCYAYNADNVRGTCNARCPRNGDMAGVGGGCARVEEGETSCLATGTVSVHARPGCSYRPGVTGVMCCKRNTRRLGSVPVQIKSCDPACSNRGVCRSGVCRCTPEYDGDHCQHPVCHGGCIPNSSCVAPGVCRCLDNHVFYRGQCVHEQARRRTKVCPRPCLHGGRCRNGRCQCPYWAHGERCEHGFNWENMIVKVKVSS